MAPQIETDPLDCIYLGAFIGDNGVDLRNMLDDIQEWKQGTPTYKVTHAAIDQRFAVTLGVIHGRDGLACGVSDSALAEKFELAQVAFGENDFGRASDILQTAENDVGRQITVQPPLQTDLY